MLSHLKTKGIAGQDFQLTCSNVWMLLAVWSIESCALIFRSERQISSDISHSHYSLPPIGSVTVFGGDFFLWLKVWLLSFRVGIPEGGSRHSTGGGWGWTGWEREGSSAIWLLAPSFHRTSRFQCGKGKVYLNLSDWLQKMWGGNISVTFPNVE